MHRAGKKVESEQAEQTKNDRIQRVLTKHRAMANHLHFPFGNDTTSQCDNYIKNEDNARPNMKEVGHIKYYVGYGRRTPAWYAEYTDQLHSSASNKLQADYQMKTEHGISRSLEDDIEHI